MMKRTMKTLMAICICVMTTFAGGITVEGKANVEGKGKDAQMAARTKALARAEKDAVEQAVKQWLQSQSPNSKFAPIADQIILASEMYVTDRLIVKDVLSSDKTMYIVSAEVSVNQTRIAEQFKAVVSEAKSAAGNPSITFVLTTYEKKGIQSYSSAKSKDVIDEKRTYDEKGSNSASATATATMNETYAASEETDLNSANSSDRTSKNSSSYKGTAQQSGDYKGSEDYSYDADGSGSRETIDGAYSVNRTGSGTNANQKSYSGTDKSTSSFSGTTHQEQGYDGSASSSSSDQYASSNTVNASVAVNRDQESVSSSYDETLWKKMSDATIIDAFQQEFKEKSFDLMAADKARRIALAPSAVGLNLNLGDREAVRADAEKEGANFVARGEAQVIDIANSNGSMRATVKLGVEIVDVNSGDIVASYSNTASAINASAEEAVAQAIKKNAILGARTLADQTLTTWSDRSANGKQFTVVLDNITSIRAQQIPFMSAVKQCGAQVISSTAPAQNQFLLKVTYKGSKDDLGMAILSSIGATPGFEEGKFDGPLYDAGTLKFKFN